MLLSYHFYSLVTIKNRDTNKLFLIPYALLPTTKAISYGRVLIQTFCCFFGGFFLGGGGREVFMVILRWKFEIFRNPHPTPDPSRSAHAQFEKLCLIRSSTAPWQQNMFKPQTSVIAIKHDMKCLIWHI